MGFFTNLTIVRRFKIKHCSIKFRNRKTLYAVPEINLGIILKIISPFKRTQVSKAAKKPSLYLKKKNNFCLISKRCTYKQISQKYCPSQKIMCGEINKKFRNLNLCTCKGQKREAEEFGGKVIILPN